MRAYWEGPQNRFIRYWTYLRTGMGFFNEWKNYILLAFGSYWTVKTSEYWLGWGLSESWLIVGFIIGMPLGLGVLLLLGHWHIYRANKPQEYFTTMTSNITKYDGFNMAVRNIEQNDEIIRLLNEITKPRTLQ